MTSAAPLADSPEIHRLIGCFRNIGEAALSDRLLNEALGLMLAAIEPVIPGSSSSIMLLDPSRFELITVATYGPESLEPMIRSRVGEGVAGWVARTGQTALVNDPERDPRFKPEMLRRIHITALISVPLFAMGQVVGVLNVYIGTRTFTGADLNLTELLATLLSASIQRHRIQELAATDSLTGLGNRRHFDAMLSMEVARTMRFGHGLALTSFDLDCMKQINDKLGHPVGDALLRQVGKMLLSLGRQTDAICRIGGDEFSAILPETNVDGALVIAERIRATLENMDTSGLPEKTRVTASFGVTTYRKGEGVDSLIERTDEALYEAKRSGGNRVVVR